MSRRLWPFVALLATACGGASTTGLGEPSDGAAPDSGADALSSCRPTTCVDLGVVCGEANDGCGDRLDCGPCGGDGGTGPTTGSDSGAGVARDSGSTAADSGTVEACVPIETCAPPPAGALCRRQVGDGCGMFLTCACLDAG